jgi:NDP-sugar pyrophosphorylase family protein
LIEVSGEPFLAHQLRLLKSSGLSRVVICAGYLGEMIQEFAGDGTRFGMEIQYSWDGPLLLGTAGALRKAAALLDERFFTIYGDSYLPCDYLAAGRTFLASGKSGLMTVFRNEGRWDSSNVEYDRGRIIAYDKKNRTPRMCHIDYGLGVFHRSAFAQVPPATFYDLATVYQHLLAADDLAAMEVDQRFYEAGSLAGIHELTEFLSK